MLLNVVTIIHFFFLKNTLFLDLSSKNKNLGNQLKNLDGNLSFFIRNTAKVSPPILPKTFQRAIVVPLSSRRNTSASSCKPKLSRSQSVSSGTLRAAPTRDSDHWENEISFLAGGRILPSCDIAKSKAVCLKFLTIRESGYW